MEIYSVILDMLFNPTTLGLVFIGTLGGILIGVLPGLSGPIGVALLLPFTFGLDPVSGLLMLGGIYMGSSYGGSIAAILLNTPGTEYAAATALDGFPLTKQGKAKEALYTALISSFFGGIVGVFFLLLFTPSLAKVALKFGPAEMFLVALAGLALVGTLAGKNIYKGLFAGAFGILIACIGPDIMTGTYRLTFGIAELRAGIPLIPPLIGLFAISEMLNISTQSNKTNLVDVPSQNIKVVEVIKKLFINPIIIIKSSLIGTLIGLLPGTGAVIASFIAYGEAKRSSKKPELFGKGNEEGIIAAESANNAAVGGSLIPLLALGVPGSATAAMLYGAITIHGLVPGPRLFLNNPGFVYSFMIGMLFTVLFMAILGFFGTRIFSRVLSIKTVYVIPIVIVLCFFGAYSIRNSTFDLLIMILFGVLGLIFKKINIPVAPVVLGIILGPIAEQGFRQTLTISRAQDIGLISYFASRPISIILFVLLVAILSLSIRSFRNN
jgi:putative tricarboxylic transport membrane protein